MKHFLLFMLLVGQYCNAQNLISIKVIPENPILGIGTYQRYKAIGWYSDNTSQDISNMVTWSSGDTAITTVSNTMGSQGFTSNIAIGNTSIKASYGTVNAVSIITVVYDADYDGIADSSDNCPFVSNSSQADIDSDGIGDACDCNTNSDPTGLYATAPKIIRLPETISLGTANVFYSTVQGGKLNPYELNPTYQWKKNGVNVGGNSATYSDNILMSTDVVLLTISSGSTCVAGNSISNSISAATLSIIDNVTELPGVFPNPAKDIIQIKGLKQISSISIYDLNGRLMETNFSKDTRINISELSTGSYLLEINTKTQKKYIIKFLKN